MSSTAPAHTILVVDDDMSIRLVASEALRQHGYQVLSASSSREALELLRQFEGTVHLLLTDVNLPGMSGGELAEEVASLRPGTRVLFMSGYSAGAALHDSVRESGVAFLAKPFVPDVLLRRVKAVLKS
jgi:DNA-binding NtrC family response regulator